MITKTNYLVICVALYLWIKAAEKSHHLVIVGSKKRENGSWKCLCEPRQLNHLSID